MEGEMLPHFLQIHALKIDHFCWFCPKRPLENSPEKIFSNVTSFLQKVLKEISNSCDCSRFLCSIQRLSLHMYLLYILLWRAYVEQNLLHSWPVEYDGQTLEYNFLKQNNNYVTLLLWLSLPQDLLLNDRQSSRDWHKDVAPSLQKTKVVAEPLCNQLN